MVVHFYDNYTGSWQTQGGGVGFSRGQIIITATTGVIDALRWYNPVAQANAPSNLVLWSMRDSFGLVELARLFTTVAPDTVGWIEEPLDVPVGVGTGQVLCVGTSVTDNVSYARLTPTFTPPPTVADLSTAPSRVSRHGSADPDQPIIEDAGSYVGFDISFTATAIGGGGDFTLSELTDEFERWLTTGGDKYPESDLPAIKGQAEGANTNAENAWTTAQQVQTDLGEFRDEWPGTLATGLGGMISAFGTFITDYNDTVRGFVEDTWGNVADLSERVGTATGVTLFSQLASAIRKLSGIDAPPALADTDDWELVDETDFTNSLEWPVEADVYVVHLTDFDPAGTSEPIGTLTRHGYLGKWSALSGTFAREWHYFNTEDAHLLTASRMPGLGLGLYRPGAGHVQAWRRTEAP